MRDADLTNAADFGILPETPDERREFGRNLADFLRRGARWPVPKKVRLYMRAAAGWIEKAATSL